MANKNLNDRYKIPFGSDWEHKDGGIYMALLVKHMKVGDNQIAIVLYSKILSAKDKKYFIDNKIKNQFVRTVEHFKNSFTQIKKGLFNE